MRNASAELKEAMRGAKIAEIQTWMENHVCVPRSRELLSRLPIKVRWVLTIKKETGKAKARLVALGFQDPDLGKIKTAAPTVSRRARAQWI